MSEPGPSGDSSAHRTTSGRRPTLAQVSLIILVGALFWLRWGGIRRGIWIDLDVYLRGAVAVMRSEPLYGVSVQGQPFTYPPFAALLFIPLQLVGAAGARWVLTVASMGCYALVIFVCARRLHASPAVAGAVALVGLTFEPIARNLLLGQINLVLATLVVVDCLVVPKRYRGTLVGLAAGVKLVPGAFVLFFILKRERGAVLRCVGSFAATVGLGAVLAPRDSRQFWSGGFINLSRFGPDAAIRVDNQSLTGALMRLSGDQSPAPIFLFLLSVGVMLLALVAAKRQIDVGDDVGGLVCIAFGSVLASPISWTHHWVWAVLAMLVLVQSRRRLASWCLGAVFVIGPMWLAPRGHLLELRHSWWEATEGVSYVAVGLIYLISYSTSPTSPRTAIRGSSASEE